MCRIWAYDNGGEGADKADRGMEQMEDMEDVEDMAEEVVYIYFCCCYDVKVGFIIK